ncbi:MAG: cadherin-like domain-containing protein [Hyphomicrobiales bacterium]
MDITAVNDAAVVSGPVDFDMVEDGSITITEAELLANASDVDGDTLSVDNIRADGGKLTDNGDGTWTFAPDKDFNGSISLQYDVSDGTVSTRGGGWINVEEANDGPTAGSVKLGETKEDTSVTFKESDLLANSTDIDGDKLTISDISVDKAFGTITDNGNGTFTFEPADNVNGDDVTFSFTVSDGIATDTSTATLNITAVNDAAHDIDLSHIEVSENEGGAVVGTLTTSDVDSGDEHSYAVSDERFEVVDGKLMLKDGVSLDHEEADAVKVTITTTDQGGLSYEEEFTISVKDLNEGPTDITFTGGKVNETVVDGGDFGTPYDPSGSTVAVLSTTDEDSGDTFSYEISNDPSGHYEIVGNEVRVKEGRVIDRESESSHDVTIKVTDSGGKSYSETVTIEVQDYEGNFTSDAVGRSIKGTSEEDTITGDAGDNAIASGDGDDTVYAGGGQDTIMGSEGADYIDGGDGIDTVDYSDSSEGVTVSIPFGNNSGGDAEGDVLVSIENVIATDHDDYVHGSNDGTVAVMGDGNDKFDNNQGHTNQHDVVDAGAGDDIIYTGDGDDTITGGAGDDYINGEGGNDTAIFSGNYSDYTITQYANSFTIRDDRPSSPDGTDTVHNVENFQFSDGTVSAEDMVNDAAVVSGPTSFSMAEDGTLTITEAELLENASDVNGDDLSVQNLAASGGDLTDNGDGTWTFSPADDFNGSINLTYDVNDGEFNTSATGTIEVAAVNDGPQAGNVDLGATAEDATVTFSEADLLANSSDIDGDSLRVASVSVSADYGSLTDNGDGTYTFEPADDVNATDVPFSFTISDGTTTDSATAVMDITAVNDNPDDIALDNSSISENISGGVIGNLTSSDVDTGDTHSYVVSDDRFEVVEGQLKLKDGISLDYETESSVSVEVTSTDQSDGTYSETFNVVVSDVNEGPTDIQFLTTNTVTTSNYGTVNGVTVTAKSINSEGGLTKASADYVTQTNTGFGVDNGSGSQTDQLEYNTNTNQSEELIFDFDTAQTSVTVDIDRLYGNEGGGGEEGVWQVYRDGEIVGAGHIDNSGEVMTTELSVTASDGGTFDQIVFTALDYGGGRTGEGNTSDYFVAALEYQSEETVSISENSDSGTVAVLSATDPEGGVFTYEFVDAEGNVVSDSNFQIVGNEVQVRSDAVIDYETDTQHELIVRVKDDGGNTHTETLTVNVVDEYEADISFDANTALSSTPSSGDVIATANFDAHPGSSSHTYSLTDDDSGKYSINSSTGELTINWDASPGDSADTITVKAKDNNGRTYEEDVTLFFGGNSDGSVEISNSNSAIVYGFGGADSLKTSDGDDVLVGGSGGDTINGNAGDDVIHGDSDTGSSKDYTSVIEQHSPLAYLKLSDSDSKAIDETGNGHNGTYQNGASSGGAGNVEGDSDASAQFDGTDDYVEIPSSSDFQIPNGTVNVWFKVDKLNGTQTIISRDSSGYDRGGHLDISVASDGYIDVRHQTSSESAYMDSSAGDAVSPGEWHMLTYSWGSTGATLYIDGEAVDTTSKSLSLEGNNEPWTIGASQQGSGDNVANNLRNYFDGSIDEVAIFDSPLSSDEIKEAFDTSGTAELQSGGDDNLNGGDGQDTVYGNEGNDTINGDAGNDILFGDAGDDKLYGGEGEDTLNGGDGKDTIDGGDGIDTVDYSTSTKGVTVSLEKQYGEGGDAEGDTIVNVENVVGSEYADVIQGDAGDNTLKGGGGDDQLSGGDGSDIFIYEIGDGSDTVYGGAGGGWTDAIELQGFSADSYGADWTLELTSGSVVNEAEGTLDLSEDASGTITLDDGSELDFQQLEQINW